MSYRYNTIDIIVGVGMCAILFGALFLFLAANGTYQAVLPLTEQSASSEDGVSALQPAIGQAIVDQAIDERRANQTVAQSVAEWNRATIAHHDLQARSSGFLGSVLREGITVPADHLARVQGVMGRAIVNFTARGVRHGLLSPDQYRSAFNIDMIRAIETRGQLLHDQFDSTWQATLGRRIVEAAQYDWVQARGIQERLGSAAMQVIRAQQRAEEGRGLQQEQLASLIVAVVRNAVPAERVLSPAVPALSDNIVAVSSERISWPDIPMGYFIAAGLMLAMVFLLGLFMAAESREAKALAQARRDADRWMYRMAT